MSIRKVSDLEGLTIADYIHNEELSNSLLESLLEISYHKTDIIDQTNGLQQHSYKSMYVTYEGIRNDFLSAILSNHEAIVFHDPVCMLCSLWLSGNFYLNLDMTEEELDNYETIMRNGNQTIYSVHNNTLCANNNIINSNTDTIIQSGNSTQICSDTKLIADFKDDTINFYSPLDMGDNDITGNNFYGTAMSARWADLAEYYEADSNYDSGTLVKFGGEKEITIADDEVNAVITQNPGFILNTFKNEAIKYLVGLVLTGRTPIKVKGKAKKFDKLYLSDVPGIATTEKINNDKVIAIALENKDYYDVGLVNCVTKMKF